MKMKCLIFFLLVLSLTTLLTNCDQINIGTTTTITNGTTTITNGTTTTTTISYLTIHYQRTAADYENFTLWLWLDTTWASEKGWPSGLDWETKDDFGTVFKVPLKEAASSIGFVPVNKTVGDDSKDAGDHVFKFLSIYKELWVFQGDSNCYVSADKETAKGIIGGYILSETEIYLNFLDVSSLTTSDLSIVDKNGSKITVQAVSKTSDSQFKVTIANTNPDTSSPYKVTYMGTTVSISLGWQALEKYTYTGNDLGCTYSGGSATFKVWAPSATIVKVAFFDKANSGTNLNKDVTLDRVEKGIWTKTISPSIVGVSDLKGYFYQYKVKNTGSTKEIACLDPYAKSMAATYVTTGGSVGADKPDQNKTGKGAIIDLTETGTVTGFANLPSDWKREDSIIYEVHIRDFTSYFGVNPTGGYPSDFVTKPTSKLGTYKAFIENLDYIKKMGYTHIQLLPVMNFYYGIEVNNDIETEYRGESCNYNWGYDPQSYFSPEGMYSTDATNPLTRVKELKELIQAIHDKGMAVTLDVVYTHMAKADFLNDLVPNYYFFMQNGAFVGSFGNNLATTHTMAKKIMIDSIKYWLSEYKVDGFRFDMMGDADQKSIMEAYDEAVKINPKVLFIGEAWRGYKGENDGAYGADQDAMNEMNNGAERIAGFSDEFRNLMKSGFGAEATPKFITGGKVKIKDLFNNIKGQPSNFNTATYSYSTKSLPNDPGQVVSYIEAHDNMPVNDIIIRHIAKSSADEFQPEIHKRIRLGNLIVLTTQGVAFMHAGQELGRTKEWKDTNIAYIGTKVTDISKDGRGGTGKFIHDSYDSSDAINQINWGFIQNGKLGRTTMLYTQGLIQLRKSTNAFRLGNKADIDTKINKISFSEEATDDLVLSYSVTGSDATYYVFTNCDLKNREATLSTDLTTGTVLVDNDEAGITAVTNPSGYTLTSSKITLEPLTAVIIKK